MNPVRIFIKSNIQVSERIDKTFIPEKFRTDGNREFIDSFCRSFLREGMTICDVGGGKQPYIDNATKARLNLRVVGLDIDAKELARAPQGLYDQTVCADITAYRGNQTADLVICQALLEHVKDVDAAFTSIASLLKPGGKAIIFVPSRNAVFARLNLMLPQKIKAAILFYVFPRTRAFQGFPSYYDRCTPTEFMKIAKEKGLQLYDSRFYYQSSYFHFFVPAYVLWRLWVMLFWSVKREQAAETFSMAFEKRP